MSRRGHCGIHRRLGAAIVLLAQVLLMSCAANQPADTAVAPTRLAVETDRSAEPQPASPTEPASPAPAPTAALTLTPASSAAGAPTRRAADAGPSAEPRPASPITAAASPAPSPTAAARPSPAASAAAPSPSPWPTATAVPQPARPSPGAEKPAGDGYYDTGNPVLLDLFVSPEGDDGHSGTSRAQPLRTIGAAWGRIPEGTLAGTGYRLNLLPGTYPCEGDCINYFADRTGTYAFPILLQAADGPGTVTLRGGLNLANVGYLYLADLTLQAGLEAGAAFGNNVLHVENGDHILLRRLKLQGPIDCITDACNDMQEVLKINQSRHVYVEQSDIAGAFQTVLDFFSVQTGHLIANHVHRSGGRCAYLKGGSAYFRVTGNEFDDCREAGFQAGEGSNLAFMRAPWLHYEAYDIKVTNNLFHDIYGAGLSVTGGYNILMAYNTLYRVGLDDETGRPWPLVQLIHGWRGCVSADEFGGDAGTAARCQDVLNQGGWGTAVLGWENGGDWIPNRNVLVLNNIFANPRGTGTHYVHFVVNGPAVPPGSAQNLPGPGAPDDGLAIRGNVIWNTLIEDAGLVGDNSGSGNIGCRAGHPTCSPAQLQAENAINTLQPQFRDPANGDFHLQDGGSGCALESVPVPDFGWGDAPKRPPVPAGDLSNAVADDRDGLPRSRSGPPGAHACP